MTFPGATAERDAANYTIIGAPLEQSVTFRTGTRTAPNRIRQYGRGYEDYDHYTDQHFSDCAVCDTGTIKPWDSQREYVDFLSGVVTDSLREGSVPIVLGGEHTVSLAGIEAVAPATVVSLDAHLDLRDSFHRNPLNHACVLRRSLETAEQAYIVGARAGSEAGWKRASAPDVTVLAPGDAADWDPPNFQDPVYLTLDIDVADPAIAPGTGTPEPFGLDGTTVRSLVRSIAPQAAAFDIVEVNDRDNGEAAMLAAKLLRAFVFAHADSRSESPN